MKTTKLQEKHHLKTSFQRPPRRVKVRVTHSVASTNAGKLKAASRKLPKSKSRPVSEEMVAADLIMVVKDQPAPRIPGLTKEMVRRHVPRLLAENILTHAPATVSDWLLTEWHLARELDLPETQLACFSPGTTLHPVRHAPNSTSLSNH